MKTLIRVVQHILDYEKWYEYYELGYTTIVSNIFDLTDDLRKLDKESKKICWLFCKC